MASFIFEPVRFMAFTATHSELFSDTQVQSTVFNIVDTYFRNSQRYTSLALIGQSGMHPVVINHLEGLSLTTTLAEIPMKLFGYITQAIDNLISDILADVVSRFRSSVKIFGIMKLTNNFCEVEIESAACDGTVPNPVYADNVFTGIF